MLDEVLFIFILVEGFYWVFLDFCFFVEFYFDFFDVVGVVYFEFFCFEFGWFFYDVVDC